MTRHVVSHFVCTLFATLAWEPAPVVNTTLGPVLGALLPSGVRRYLSVPFAAPPVGPLRFTAPAPRTPWTDVLNASAVRAWCIQFPGDGPLVPVPEDEDCLHARFTIPPRADGDPLLPVLVWLHGGGNTQDGNAGWDTSAWSAALGAIVVEVPYRLGILGWLAIGDGAGAGGAYAPNAGLLDAIAGLRFVADNAERFGGDPARVTLGGESAGAIDATALLVSPAAAGLFARVIADSGGPVVMQPRAAVAATAVAAAAAPLNCTGAPTAVLACLRAADVAALHSAAAGGAPAISSLVVDGAVLPGVPLELIAAGRFPPSTAIFALTNGWEGDSFYPCPAEPDCALNEAEYLLYVAEDASTFQANASWLLSLLDQYAAWPPAVGYFRAATQMTTDTMGCYARALAAAGTAHGTGGYRVNVTQGMYFEQVGSASPLNRSTHTHELYLLFNRTNTTNGALSADQAAVRDLLHAWFGNFIQSGNPNIGLHAPQAPPWPVFNADGDQLAMLAAPAAQVVSTAAWDVHCDFWTTALRNGIPVSPAGSIAGGPAAGVL